MICKKCGFNIDEVQKFCPNCGTEISEDEFDGSEKTVLLNNADTASTSFDNKTVILSDEGKIGLTAQERNIDASSVPVATHYQLNKRRYRANPFHLRRLFDKQQNRRECGGFRFI